MKTNTNAKMTTELETVVGRVIMVDRSGGHGHCWRQADLSADMREEIAAEILDGREECRDYRATDGEHYRWGGK